tara:strand:- start:1172 stop:1906 length:735 start_codon:yes stop_codon:yes gene_type:complete
MAKKLPRLTLGLTYFNDEKWIHEWYHQFKFYPSEVEIIIFDDASDHSPIEEVLYPIMDMPDHTPEISIYKVTKDLGFNSHGCRNAIAKLAKSEFICFFDIDMLCMGDTMGRMKQRNWQHHSLYHHQFYQFPIQRMLPYPGHINSFLCSKQLFWEAGGYDESFTGYHYGDREFIARLQKKAQFERDSGEVMMLRRMGKHGSVRPEYDKTVYFDDKYFIQPDKEENIKKLTGTVKEKVNFSYERIL